MINANTINYYDIVSENEFGRCRTIRYKQYMYSDILGKDGIPNYELCNYGCGPTSLATILSSEGYDYDPIEVAKLMYLDEFGNTLDFYTNRRNGRRGATFLGFLYVLQELARSNVDIEYQLVKCSYEHPELKRYEITSMIQDGYMALILVGPNGRIEHPRTFSNYGHYIAVTSIHNETLEFYVANPNRTGDNQIDTTFSNDVLTSNMYQTGNWLMIKNKSLIKKL